MQIVFLLSIFTISVFIAFYNQDLPLQSYILTGNHNSYHQRQQLIHTAFGFHIQTINKSTSIIQQDVQSVETNLNNTSDALQIKNIPLALKYLQTAQQQLSQLKNSSLIKVVSTE